MITLHLHRAQPTPGEATPPTTIVIGDEVDRDDSEAGSIFRKTLFREEARALTIALRGSLPGGTIDALLVEMLEGKLSEFVVARPVNHATSQGGDAALCLEMTETMVEVCREVSVMLTGLARVAGDTDGKHFVDAAQSVDRLLDAVTARLETLR